MPLARRPADALRRFASTAEASSTALIRLSALDTLKLSFTVTSEPCEAGAAAKEPQQVSALFGSASRSDQSVSVPLRIRKAGKARLELDLSRSSFTPALAALGPDVRLSLIAARFGACPAPLLIDLATLELGVDLLARAGTGAEAPPAQWEVERFSKRPEIAWTFRTGEKPIAAVISATYALAFVVGAPWILLAIVVRPRFPRLSNRAVLSHRIRPRQGRRVPVLPHIGLPRPARRVLRAGVDLLGPPDARASVAALRASVDLDRMGRSRRSRGAKSTPAQDAVDTCNA